MAHDITLYMFTGSGRSMTAMLSIQHKSAPGAVGPWSPAILRHPLALAAGRAPRRRQGARDRL
jgi:hypothetical protein